MRLAGKPVRIDLAYPDLRIAIEVDSWEYHGQIRSQFDCDHIRRDELILLQWTPFTFTSAMSDEYIASSTRTLFERATAPRGPDWALGRGMRRRVPNLLGAGSEEAGQRSAMGTRRWRGAWQGGAAPPRRMSRATRPRCPAYGASSSSMRSSPPFASPVSE